MGNNIKIFIVCIKTCRRRNKSLKNLLLAKNNLLEDEGPISFLPVKVQANGTYHIYFDGEAIVLCYNSVTDTTFLMKVCVDRKVTSGPCDFETEIYLLQCDDVWAEHVLQEETLQVRLPQVEKSIEIFSQKISQAYDGRVTNRNEKESFDKLPQVPQKNVNEFLDKLKSLFIPSYVEPDSSLENLKKLYEKPFPGYRCSWVRSRAKSANK